MGFTIIELLTAFSLASVVMVMLFNILVMVKKTYTQKSIQSELWMGQALLARELYHDTYEYTLETVSGSKNNYTLTFQKQDGTTLTKTLKITETAITYGDYQYKVPNNSEAKISISSPQMTNHTGSTHGYVLLNIPIYSSVTGEKKNYGVNVIYLYTNGKVTISITS